MYNEKVEKALYHWSKIWYCLICFMSLWSTRSGSAPGVVLLLKNKSWFEHKCHNISQTIHRASTRMMQCIHLASSSVFCHQKFPKVVFAVFCTAPCCLRFWNFREGNREWLLQWFGAFWEFCVVSIQPIACVRKSHFRKRCFFFKTECCTVFNGTWINFYSSKIMKCVAGGKINFGLVPKERHFKYIFFAGLPWGFLTFFDQALLYFFILNFELRKISECIFENDRCILICTLISRDDKFKQRKIICLNHVYPHWIDFCQVTPTLPMLKCI